MGKMVFCMLTMLMVASIVLAQGPDRMRPEDMIIEGFQDESGNGPLASPGGPDDTRGPGNVQQIREKIQEKEREMEKEMENMSEYDKKVFGNQNAIRLAVHALLSMENRAGGIGRNISQIAREFNNSVNKTLQAEEKIQKRNAVARFFFGGDKTAAEEIENETVKNREHFRNLGMLIEKGKFSDEERALLQEQIRNIELEQERLRVLAETEKKSKGLLGWLWK